MPLLRRLLCLCAPSEGLPLSDRWTDLIFGVHHGSVMQLATFMVESGKVPTGVKMGNRDSGDDA